MWRSNRPDGATGPRVLRELLGFDKRVLQLADGTVLRYPMNSDAKIAMGRERWALAKLAGKTTLRIPTVRYVGEDERFDVCTFLPGVWLTHERWLKLSPASRRDVAHQLGTFLAEVHGSLDVKEALTAGIGGTRWPLASSTVVSALRGTLSLEDAAFLQEVLARAEQLVPDARSLRVLHNDLGGHNFAFTPRSGTLLGVYDFSDMGVGDLHQDFQYLPAYGPELADEAAERYEKLTGTVLCRREIYLRHALCTFSQVAFAAEDPTQRSFSTKLTWIAPTRERYGKLL